MKIINQTRSTILATQLEIADTSSKRMKGLLGRDSLSDGEALKIVPCQSVHMVFMRFAIDVIFLNDKNCVVGYCSHLKPFQFSPIFFNSCCAIELPAGKIEQTQTRKGDSIEIK